MTKRNDLVNFSSWLQEEADCQSIVVQVGAVQRRPNDHFMRERKPIRQYQPTITVLYGVSSGSVRKATDSFNHTQDPVLMKESIS